MKEVLIELVKRVSRKAVILAIAMVLVYMVIITPNAVNAVIAIGVISGLSIVGAGLQFYLDLKKIKDDETDKI